MLFNSPLFLTIFLPITLGGFYLFGRWRGRNAALIFLLLACLAFYAYSSLFNFGLFICSVAANFMLGYAIAHFRASQLWLIGGIVLNLALIGIFKYSGLVVSGVNDIFGATLVVPVIALPVGISFYTFEQISYLIETRQRQASEPSLTRYALFASFFPHLIAGPIIRPHQLLPQFSAPAFTRFSWPNFATGTTFLLLGLIKKTIFADQMAAYATPVFAAAANGGTPDFVSAWGGALAYAFQIYFDFSGYSDMAIGISRIFGIRLPLNFDSPYKSANIIEFWRRWHMTLSRFLRDYLYIPLGGGRKGNARRYLNLMLTMLLGGLWHGAGWNFAVWGMLHGAYLMINHAWAALAARLRLPVGAPPWRLAGVALTFAAVCFAWVFFRATDFSRALTIVGAMCGNGGIALPESLAAHLHALQPLLDKLGVTFYVGGGTRFVQTWLWVLVGAAICFAMPNTQQIMRRYEPALDFHAAAGGSPVLPTVPLAWLPNRRWAVAVSVLLLACLLSLGRPAEFLYFQF